MNQNEEILNLRQEHNKLSYDFEYHKKEFEEMKSELRTLGKSLQDISQSIRMIKYVGIGAFVMYMFQSTGTFHGLLKILFAL